MNNVVSESEDNVLAYGGNSSKNILTVKGNVTLSGNFAISAMNHILGNITAGNKQSVSILKNTVTGSFLVRSILTEKTSFESVSYSSHAPR